MSEIALRTGDSPTGGGSGGGGATFVALAGSVAKLTVQAIKLREGVHALQRWMAANADRAREVSEMCDAAEVEPQLTAMIMQASDALRRVAEASGEMVDASDAMRADAQGLHDAHQREYRGIYETVQASGVQQAKPGFYRVR